MAAGTVYHLPADIVCHLPARRLPSAAYTHGGHYFLLIWLLAISNGQPEIE
jgi:hypothetical protein